MTTIWFVTCVVVALVAGMLYGKKSSRAGRTDRSESTGRNEVAPYLDPVEKVVDEQVLKAFDLLPIGVVISRKPKAAMPPIGVFNS